MEKTTAMTAKVKAIKSDPSASILEQTTNTTLTNMMTRSSVEESSTEMTMTTNRTAEKSPVKAKVTWTTTKIVERKSSPSVPFPVVIKTTTTTKTKKAQVAKFPMKPSLNMTTRTSKTVDENPIKPPMTVTRTGSASIHGVEFKIGSIKPAMANELTITNMTIDWAPMKPRFVFEHVWKTGGTELCKLARANGWSVPEQPGCTLFWHHDRGWPKEDYDMIGNEAAFPDGKVSYVYKPRNEITKQKYDSLAVQGVKWLTTLRHPYSRTISHFQHIKKGKAFVNLTLETFLTTEGTGGFSTFIPNQQTRWHSGTGPSVNTRKTPIVTKDILEHAMANLRKMHAVLILEDMSSPQSCTRRQMRHVLNFTKVESFSDAKEQHIKKLAVHKTPQNNWDDAIRPYLDPTGRSSNETILKGFGTSESNQTAVTMAALAIHNDMDMLLYGYAQHLCEVLADKYDRLADESRSSTMSTAVRADLYNANFSTINTTHANVSNASKSMTQEEHAYNMTHQRGSNVLDTSKPVMLRQSVLRLSNASVSSRPVVGQPAQQAVSNDYHNHLATISTINMTMTAIMLLLIQKQFCCRWRRKYNVTVKPR